MKIVTTTTEIECTAEELRQSNSLSDGFYNVLRKAFNGPIHGPIQEVSEEEEDEEDGN